MNFNLFDIFNKGDMKSNIVLAIILTVVGISILVTPEKVLDCQNGFCSLTKGKNVLATFSSSDVSSCSYREVAYESCERVENSYTSKRHYVREKCKTAYKYLPSLVLKSGQTLNSDKLFTFYSKASADVFCDAVKSGKSYVRRTK